MITKLIITGANGYIGSEISRLAVAMGHEVVGIARRGKAHHDEPWTHGVTWLSLDAANTPAWRSHLKGTEALIHTTTLDKDHIETTQRLLDVACEANLQKFVYLTPAPGISWSETWTTLANKARALVEQAPIPHAILEIGLAWDDERRPLPMAQSLLLPNLAAQHHEHHPIRMEHVAMAALRASLETQMQGVITPDKVAYFGDAMMIQ